MRTTTEGKFPSAEQLAQLSQRMKEVWKEHRAQGKEWRKVIGREDIRAGSNERRATGGVGPGSNSRHVITTIAVEFADEDTAVVDSYWLYYVDTHEVPRLTLMGHYHDTVVRTDDGWRMARREISFG